jgi:hypothetical protein
MEALMFPRNAHGWARALSVTLDSVILEADPEGLDATFDQARELLDRYSFWRAEMSGQLSVPIAAHGCHCHEEETE